MSTGRPGRSCTSAASSNRSRSRSRIRKARSASSRSSIASPTGTRWNPPRRATKVFADSRIDVRAIRVHHGSVPAVGYRIRTPDVDVVLSGDRSAGHDSFPAFAKGADVLFHEVLARTIVLPVLEAQGQAPSFINHLINDHSDPQSVGRIATGAGVGTLVLYHLIPGNSAISDAAWTAMVSPYFAGTIVVARDLMVV